MNTLFFKRFITLSAMMYAGYFIAAGQANKSPDYVVSSIEVQINGTWVKMGSNPVSVNRKEKNLYRITVSENNTKTGVNENVRISVTPNKESASNAPNEANVQLSNGKGSVIIEHVYGDAFIGTATFLVAIAGSQGENSSDTGNNTLSGKVTVKPLTVRIDMTIDKVNIFDDKDAHSSRLFFKTSLGYSSVANGNSPAWVILENRNPSDTKKFNEWNDGWPTTPNSYSWNDGTYSIEMEEDDYFYFKIEGWDEDNFETKFESLGYVMKSLGRPIDWPGGQSNVVNDSKGEVAGSGKSSLGCFGVKDMRVQAVYKN